MIRDYASEFSTNQIIPTAAGTAVSTNYLDTQLVGGDAGVGNPVELAITVTEKAVGGTNASFQLYTDSVSTFGTEVLVYDSGAILTAALAKGKTVAAKLPFGCKQFLRLKVTAVGTFSAGRFTAGIVKGVDQWTAIDPVGYKF